jgi:hypothetical protein
LVWAAVRTKVVLRRTVARRATRVLIVEKERRSDDWRTGDNNERLMRRAEIKMD